MVDSRVTVIPGDAVHLPNVSTRLGPGVAVTRNKEGNVVPFVCKAGVLQRKGEESVWVQSQQKRVGFHGDYIRLVKPKCQKRGRHIFIYIYIYYIRWFTDG